MANLCIIPARGGSKRIPRKNIKDFLGIPIIAYSIRAAIDSGLFSEVMVSTDDAEIAHIARQYGAVVPFMRSKENADDFATTIGVIQEVLAAYQIKGRSFDYVCCVYPTAPLVAPGRLQDGLEKLKHEQVTTVFPVVEFSYPIWRGLKIEEGLTRMIWPENLNSRSQDLPKTYHDAGQWYWLVPAKVSDSLFTNRTSSVVLDESEVQDIDNESDWTMAEMKYIRKHGQKKNLDKS